MENLPVVWALPTSKLVVLQGKVTKLRVESLG